eukprot:PhF_6_TR11301/c0_g1_i4/m.18243
MSSDFDQFKIALEVFFPPSPQSLPLLPLQIMDVQGLLPPTSILLIRLLPRPQQQPGLAASSTHSPHSLTLNNNNNSGTATTMSVVDRYTLECIAYDEVGAVVNHVWLSYFDVMKGVKDSVAEAGGWTAYFTAIFRMRDDAVCANFMKTFLASPHTLTTEEERGGVGKYTPQQYSSMLVLAVRSLSSQCRTLDVQLSEERTKVQHHTRRTDEHHMPYPISDPHADCFSNPKRRKGVNDFEGGGGGG